MERVQSINDDSIAKAAAIIHEGGVVVMPTDTVYGVVADPNNADAINRIFEVKQRPRYKSLQVILSSIDQLEQLHLVLPSPLNRLAAQLLPGPFSPIALALDDCTLQTLHTMPNGARTQGIRVPNSALCLRALRGIGPVAASSANRSGTQSAQCVEEAVEAFGNDVDLYLDGGPTKGHVASTVVAANPLERDGIEILREGVIPERVIRKALIMNGGGLGA